MSEYQTPESLDRLLGDANTPQEQAAPLIAQVRKQPFSVLLLDEFEKAHPQIWDLFLQVFDDGRLTDRNGRTVDLRHCVIILTSNLGSAIPTGPGVGFVGRSGEFDAASVLKSVDRVVPARVPEPARPRRRLPPARPRGHARLLEKELNDVLERRGFRMRPWAVEWDEGAVDFLIEQGFSAEFGARPLKRAVERHLLTRIATAIVERQFPEGDQFLFITARDETGLDVAFVDPDAGEPEPGPARSASRSGRPHPRSGGARAGGNRGGGGLSSGASSRPSSGASARWDEPKQDALAAAREPAFWQSEERHQVLGLIEYIDRLGAATATAERLGARLSSARDAHSRELLRAAGHAPARARGRARRPRRARGERRDRHRARG